jgi:phosphopantothenoylcysteine decarboxylase/phosphopantothenate--cysteine ligase
LPLKGKKILITAVPTYEAIDPVRFIGNYSSGKMGFDIAKSAADKGASVILVSGPTSYTINHNSISLHPVVSAEEMFEICTNFFPEVDVFISAAAVADYKPKIVAAHKIKKETSQLIIELEKTTDILGTLAINKTSQFVVGFALETENEIENAIKKIKKKNLDLIVLNSMQDEGAGFGTSTNKVTFIDRDLKIEPMELKTKEAVAEDIINKVIHHFYEDSI